MKRCVMVVLLLVALHGGARAITLEAALARTLERNPQIRAAKLQLEEAAGRRLMLRSRGLPDVRVGVPVGVQGGKRAGEKSVQPFAFGVGSFIQPLFDPAVPASFRRGDVGLLIAQQRLNVAIVEQLHAARLAFYTAAYNNSLGAFAEAQRQRLQRNVQAQSDRYQIGRADRAAVTSAHLLEAEVNPRLEEIHRLTSGALLQLSQSMADEQLPTIEGELQFANVNLDLQRETKEALEDRADLKLARLLVRAATEDQRIIEAQYYPAINATIGGTYIPVSDVRQGSSGSARRSEDVVSSEVRLGGTFTWRVIDNGLVTGAVIQQRAAREINELVLARLEADVPRELTRIRNNLQSLQARYDGLTKGAAVAERTVADVQTNLAEGRASQLEYRSAETSFLETRASLLRAAYEQSIALAERDRVTGRYFQFSDATGKVH